MDNIVDNSKKDKNKLFIIIVPIFSIIIIIIIYITVFKKKPVVAGKTGPTGPSLDIYYPYPECATGGVCIVNDKTIPGMKYSLSDGRCFQSVNEQPITVLEQSISGNIQDPSTYFISCKSEYDTRSNLLGRFVQLEKNDGLFLSIKQLEVYVLDSTGNLVFVKPIDVHVNNYLAGQDYYVLANKDNDIDVVTDIGIQRSYIRLDLGSNLPIREIKIKKADDKVDPDGRYIVGSTIYILKDVNDPMAPVYYKNDITDGRLVFT